jgi:hypothetical protein
MAKVAVAVASAGVLALSADAAVAAPFHLEVPAGTACTFGLAVDGVGGDHQVLRTFLDTEGNTVRTLTAGRGFQLTFTNLSSGARLALPANGAVTHTVVNADGSQTVTTTGHNCPRSRNRPHF